MARHDFPVVGSLHEDIITKVDAERTINMYEVRAVTGKKPTFLHPTPGKKSIASFSQGNTGRASFTFKGFVYFVVGDTIYRMDNTLVPNVIALHFFTTLTGHIGIAANENEVIFVDGVKAFLWNVTTSTGIDDTPNFPAGFKPLDVTFMDGSFIAISGSVGFQNTFFVSALNNGASWPVTDFALINSRPTILNGVAVLKRRIFFFGQTKSELWIDAGASDFRFRRDNNLLLEHGVKAISSISQAFDRLFYLSGDQDGVGAIMMVAGITPQPISTRQMDERIQKFTAPEDATGFAYKINGQIFYQINFTTDNHTYVFNSDTGNWHELEMANGSRDIANTHSFFGTQHFLTSYNNNKLYELSPNLLDNDGEKIKRTRICRTASSPTYERIRYSRMQLDMLKGVGRINTKPLSSLPPFPIVTQQQLMDSADVDPKVFLSISEDGGATYHSLGTASFGQAGDRLIRIIWRSLGTYRDAIFKFEIYNAVPVYILGAAIDMDIDPQ
jgi:hypothetical protein